MATLLVPPDPLSASGDLMTSVRKPSITTQLMRKAPAANADRLAAVDRDTSRSGARGFAQAHAQAQEHAHGQVRVQQSLARPQQDIESTGGWDAYEVWRRFIKDARDRRRQSET